MAAFFTELFRVEKSNVESLFDPELERDPATSLWLRHLGDLELVGLWESLPDARSEGTLMADVLADDGGEQLVFSLPDNFIDSIDSISGGDVDAVVGRWAEMEELADSQSSDLAQVVGDIRSLVRNAKANHQIVVQLAGL